MTIQALAHIQVCCQTLMAGPKSTLLLASNFPGSFTLENSYKPFKTPLTWSTPCQCLLLTVEFVNAVLMIRLTESVFQLECPAVLLACMQSIFTVQLPPGRPWSWDGGNPC